MVYSAFTQSTNVWSVPVPTNGIALSSQAVPVTTGSQIVEQFSISPDGQWLAFDSDISGNQDIWKMPLTGGSPQQLTSGPEDEFTPSWSHDGREITFHSFKFGNRDVFVMPSTGGDPRPAVVGPGQDRGGEFSPDDKKLAFQSNRDGRWRTYVTTRVGDGWGKPTLLFKNGRLGGNWSPNGRYLMAFDSLTTYVLRSSAADSTPEYVVPHDSMIDVGFLGEWTADSRGYLVAGHHRTLGWGIWLHTLWPLATRQVLKIDDRNAELGGGVEVSGTRLYFSITHRESDVWTAEMISR